MELTEAQKQIEEVREWLLHLLTESLRAAEMRQGCTNHSYYAEIIAGQILSHPKFAILDNDHEKDTLKKVRELFLKYLTEDSKTTDARRKDFNQAIFFDLSEKLYGGHQVFNGTNLDMVLEKFDKAVTALKRGEMPEVRK